MKTGREISLQSHEEMSAQLIAVDESQSPIIYYALFFVTGIATVLLGVLLPQARGHEHFGDADAGRLLALQFTGQLIGALLVGRNVRKALLGGLVLTSISAACLVGIAQLMQEFLFVYGLGLGVVMTATNILVGTEATGARRASRLEMLNTFWPVGAAMCPWLTVLLRSGMYPLLPYATLTVSFAVLFGLILFRRPSQTFKEIEEGSRSQKSSIRLLFSCCALGLLAVGVESSVAGWLTTFGSRYLSTNTAVPWLPTLFWCGLLLGRLTASRAIYSIRSGLLNAISAAGALVMVALFAFSRDGLTMCIAAFGCAFAVGPLYPMVLALSVDLRWKNFVFFSAGIGSAFVPWLVGRTSAWSGSLRYAMTVPAGAALLLLILLSLDRRDGSARYEGEPS
jgi:fucose permease